MKKWRFALTERWLTYLGMAIIFSVACALLSQWQFSRNAQTEAAHNLVSANFHAAVVPLSKIVPTTKSYSANNIWRKVSVVGVYDPAKQLLVRDRTHGANPGFDVLTPIRLANGRYFIVDRGWLPVGTTQDRPDVIPAPPKGTIHVTAWLQGNEAVLPGRVAPTGEISEINLPTVARTLTGSTYTAAYGLLRTETPAPPDRPVRTLAPVNDPGPYLSYAVQWILFALFAFFALGRALRAERRILYAEDPEEIARAAERERKARLRDPSDSQVEDEQLGVSESNLEPVDPTAVGAVIHDKELRERLTARYGTAIVPRVKTQRTRQSSPGSADNTKPDNTKPDNTKPDNTKPDNTKPDANPDDANPDDVDHDAADTLIDAS
jgi:cytochrome oxidase assembly protein ShyY1